MEWFDVHTLARMQFAFTVSFHIIFPSFSIGLASYLAVLNVLHLATVKQVYITLFNYWKKIFAVAFGMGVERLAMLKYGMPDLRDFFAADDRWLKHYGFSPYLLPGLAQGIG